jgi:hypothetical protein
LSGGAALKLGSGIHNTTAKHSANFMSM